MYKRVERRRRPGSRRDSLFAVVTFIIAALSAVGQQSSSLLAQGTRRAALLDPITAMNRLGPAFTAAGQTKDASALALLFVEQATLVPPRGNAVQSQSAIRSFWQTFFAEGGRDFSLTATDVAVGDGAIGYQAGVYEAVTNSDGETTRDRGTYLMTLDRNRGGPDGAWRILDAIFKSDIECPR